MDLQRMYEIGKHVMVVFAGMIVGSVVNMGIVMLGYRLVTPPSGFDLNDPKQLALALPHFLPVHFVAPFAAHFLGTFTGALLSALFISGRPSLGPIIIGLLFLLGGISMAIQVPAPMGFIALDLGLAYIPSAWLGYLLASRLRSSKKS